MKKKKVIKMTGMVFLTAAMIMTGISSNGFMGKDGATKVDFASNDINGDLLDGIMEQDANELYDVNDLSDSDYNINSVSIKGLLGAGTQVGHTKSISLTNGSKLTDGQTSVVKKADDLYNFSWTAKKTVSTWNDQQSITKGKTIYGVPYGQTGSYVGYNVSVAQFKKDVANENSNVYKTKTITTSKGNKRTFPIESSDCSGFVSYCWGLSNRCTTSTLTSNKNVKTVRSASSGMTKDAFNSLKVGDAFNKAGDHVVLVTGIDFANEKAEITEQCPQGTFRGMYTIGNLNTLMKSKGYSLIRNTNLGTGDIPTPVDPEVVSGSSIKDFQKWLNSNFSSGLDVDGQFGPKTKTAAIKAWQKTVGLTQDGVFGPDCKNEAAKHVLKKGSSGTLVKILQGMLTCKGYSCDIDGQFGSGTESSLKSFQGDKGLSKDGMCGKDTWSAIFDASAGTQSSSSSTTKTNTVKSFQQWLNSNFSSGLDVDGQFGPKTKTAAIKAWQKTVGLTQDGVFGPDCKNEAAKHVLKKGSKGTLVKILQGMLTCKGYACDIDGEFGSGTESSLKSYQKAKNLDVDGMCGKGTWTSIFS